MNIINFSSKTYLYGCLIIVNKKILLNTTSIKKKKI